MSVATCPKCGALITPQLERCRQCGKYLHGTRAEGWLLASLPAPLRASPGTGMLFIAIVVCYLAVVVIALPASPLAFTAYTLRHVGATHGPSIMLGEWWRVVTANFVHHDVLHIAFNLYALIIAGPVVERLFDRKKMLLMYIAAGVGSMIASHAWYVGIMGGANILVTSAGASGAVSGLIGAAWVGALRYNPAQPHIAKVMQRWTVTLVIWGFVVPGINNAAHAGGFLVGAALARGIPTGLTQTVKWQRVLSLLTALAYTGALACGGLMLRAAHGYPGSLADDYYAPRVLGFQLADPPAWEDSAQVSVDRACINGFTSERPLEERLRACELAVRVNSHHAPSYELLARLEIEAGDPLRAEKLRALARRLDQIGE